MADKTVSDALVTIASNVVTWLLVIVGWLVVSDQNIENEAAKNSYFKMSRLRDDMSRIEADAVDHHTIQYDEKRVRSLLRSISLLGIEISQLVKNKYLGGGAIGMVTELRRAVTAKNFDFSDYSKQTTTAEIIQEIEVTKDQLDRVLMEAADNVSVKRRTLGASLVSTWRRLI